MSLILPRRPPKKGEPLRQTLLSLLSLCLSVSVVHYLGVFVFRGTNF